MSKKVENKKEEKPIVPTTAKEWKERANKTFKIYLQDSGVFVEVRRLNLVEIGATGSIPMTLVQASMATTDKMTTIAGVAKATQKELQDMIEMMQKYAVLAVVNPVVSEEPKNENEMDVKEIPFNDLVSIFGQASVGEERDFRPFLEEQDTGNSS